MKIKSPKQINRILQTFRKNDKEVYNNILMIADQMGIATKSAFLPASKRRTEKIINERAKKDDIQRFYARVSRYYGHSYTAYTKRKEKRYERYKKATFEAGLVPLKRRDWIESRHLMGRYANELFKFAQDSNEARDVVIVAETLFERDEEGALNYLRRQVERMKKDYVPDNPF